MTIVPNHPFRWQDITRPLNDALLALGRLQQALSATAGLHGAWLWRENVRTACKIAQISGHRVTFDRLAFDLLGVPPRDDDDVGGLAAGRRHFLDASRLFAKDRKADSILPSDLLWAPLWCGDSDMSDLPARPTDERAGGGSGDLERAHAIAIALAGAANRVADVPLVTVLRSLQQGACRSLPRPLARLVLPLALFEAGLVPKPVPALLGGRLSLGEVGSEIASARSASWLRRALTGLAKEADGAAKRLDRLKGQVESWRDLLAKEKLRRHAKAPKVLALLAATPVLTTSLAVRHVGISKVAASKILIRLAELGIVTEPIKRKRFKIFVTADLGKRDDPADQDIGFAPGGTLPEIDRDAIESNLKKLFADIEEKSRRAEERLRAGALVECPHHSISRRLGKKSLSYRRYAAISTMCWMGIICQRHTARMPISHRWLCFRNTVGWPNTGMGRQFDRHVCPPWPYRERRLFAAIDGPFRFQRLCLSGHAPNRLAQRCAMDGRASARGTVDIAFSRRQRPGAVAVSATYQQTKRHYRGKVDICRAPPILPLFLTREDLLFPCLTIPTTVPFTI